MRWIMALIAAATINVAVAAEATKVAVVDMERALFLSDATQEALKEFEKANKERNVTYLCAANCNPL